MRLVQAVQDLSLSRDLASVMAVVRRAARQLTGADGATFVLREGDLCHYADEDAVSPLWKGQRFPLGNCISGWAMLNRKPAVIEDIYADPRIPADAYRPTFVKSLVMVPIRRDDPIGAIGNYWAERRQPSPGDVRLLQALADSASIAMENVGLYSGQERRIAERTAELVRANEDLEAFIYTASHDLRSPLHAIDGFARALAEEYGGRLEERGRKWADSIAASSERMESLIESLLKFSRITKVPLVRVPIDLSSLAREIALDLQLREPARHVEFQIQPSLWGRGDADLVRDVLANLLGNAWKFAGKVDHPMIEFGVVPGNGSGTVYRVRDNGAGFDPASAGKLFTPFTRLHPESDFKGTGIGLASVARIIQRHGGKVWAESIPGAGASFFFTLEPPPASHSRD